MNKQVFYMQLNMFSYMKISYTCCRHFGTQILNQMNTKNEPNGKTK